jgi:single-strand DNA-binding protein
MLIGNLTRDPELRYTPQGTPVCSFGLATNRSWQPARGGDRQEETEFHRIVAWNKLAELCSQLLFKGRKVFVEGRLQTRNWTTSEGQERQTVEIVIDSMIVLDSKRKESQPGGTDYAAMDYGTGGATDAGGGVTPQAVDDSQQPAQPAAVADQSETDDTAAAQEADVEVETEAEPKKSASAKKPAGKAKAKKEEKKEEKKVEADDIPF